MKSRATEQGALRSVVASLAIALAVGCVDTGQDRAQVPLSLAGTLVEGAVEAAADVPVVIERADLAFGPLYLCAGATAGDLCETARLEWLETAVVDATDPRATRVGELWGVTGPVRSWMYDLGISSQLTRAEPFVLDAARDLGGVSLVLEGVATVDGIALPFTARVAVQQTDETEQGVPVVRKSASETFFRDVGTDEAGLLVRFDPRAWVRGVDFRPFVERRRCAPDAPDLVCDGTVERRCERDVELAARDCAAEGEICVPDAGCRPRLTFEEGTQAYRALRNALVSGARPRFEWGAAP